MFLLTVAAIWTIAALTPGPNFFLIVRCTLTGSRKIAISAAAGTLTGTLCWGLAGWLGVGSLFMAAPIAYMGLKIAGGIYLLWLGLRLLWQLRQPAGDMTIPASKVRLTPLGAWRLGLATNLANPKSALFVASLFAATMRLSTGTACDRCLCRGNLHWLRPEAGPVRPLSGARQAVKQRH